MHGRNGKSIHWPEKNQGGEILEALNLTSWLFFEINPGVLILAIIPAAVLAVLAFSRNSIRRFFHITRRFNPLVGRRKLIRLYERERYLRNALQTVAYINQLLVTETELEPLLQKSCEKLARHSHYRLAWIGFIEGDRCTMRYRSGDPSARSGSDLYISLNPESEYSKGPVGRAILGNRTIVLSSTETDPAYRPWRERALKNGIHALAAFPLRGRSDLPPFGVLTVGTPRKEGFDRSELPMLEELAGDIGFAVHSFRNREKLTILEKERLQAQEQLIETLARFIEQRDAYTAGHQERVAKYCEVIAKQMGYDEEAVSLLVRSARLHDIGKVSTPDSILLKPSRLDEFEYRLISMHVTTGYTMLSGAAMYREIAEIMRYHHEHYDGSGYPDHLKGDAVPPLARILVVADSFDAMTTNRIYRPRKTRETALMEIRSLSGIWYDPEVVDAALLVLCSVPLDESARQDPSSMLELERFAYFYRDQLTGLYNERYMRSLMETNTLTKNLRSYLIGLRDFHSFNRSRSWQEGDQLLKRFADLLRELYPDALLFRVFGDDFALFLREDQPSPDVKSLKEFLENTGVDVEIISNWQGS